MADHTEGADPALLGRFTMPDGTTAPCPPSSCSRSACSAHTPEWAAGITGIPAATIRRLAHEMGITARDQKIEAADRLDRLLGQRHDTVTTGNPVAFHAMRGLGCAQQRLPDHPRAGYPDDLLGTIDRPAVSAILPARGAAERTPAQGPE